MMETNNVSAVSKNFSQSDLKLLACFCMFSDHLAVIFLKNGIAYELLRVLGRMAFPIFLFFLVEGVQRTKHPGQYLVRMGLLAFLSEIPYDLALQGCWLSFGAQNIFWTLLISLATLLAFQKWETILEQRSFPHAALWFGRAVLLYCGMELATVLKADWGGTGVLAAVVMYLFRFSQYEFGAGVLVLAAFFQSSVEGLLAIPLIHRYNGQRGQVPSLVFYLFYPVHFLLLYLVAHFYGGI